MTVKTITVTEEAYESIKKLKKSDESFSELLLRLSSRGNNLNNYFGSMPDLTLTYDDVKKIRKNISRSFKRRQHVYS